MVAESIVLNLAQLGAPKVRPEVTNIYSLKCSVCDMEICPPKWPFVGISQKKTFSKAQLGFTY